MTLADIKNLIESRDYEITQKIKAFIDDGFFEREDLECCVLSATRVYKRERDEQKQAVDGFKYTIVGWDTSGFRFYTVGKVLQDYTGRYYFFITAHQAD